MAQWLISIKGDGDPAAAEKVAREVCKALGANAKLGACIFSAAGSSTDLTAEPKPAEPQQA